MSHNIVTLMNERFDTRAVIGPCLINISGETMECLVEKDATNGQSPTYTVLEKKTRKELCTFRPFHLHGGPSMYQIEGASASGGDATLIVPKDEWSDGDDQDD